MHNCNAQMPEGPNPRPMHKERLQENQQLIRETTLHNQKSTKMAKDNIQDKGLSKPSRGETCVKRKRAQVQW